MYAPLGRLVVLTDRHQAEAAGHTLEEVVGAATTAGADTIVFREKDLGPQDRLDLGRRVARVMCGSGARLVVASDADLAAELDADGVHAARTDPAAPSSGHAGRLWGRSCHDAREINAAVSECCDYVTISPVFESPSKPGHGPPLGAERASDLIAQAAPDLPAYGLGGITPARAPSCLEAGLVGVAVMGVVMGATDPAAVIAEFVATSEGAEQ